MVCTVLYTYCIRSVKTKGIHYSTNLSEVTFFFPVDIYTGSLVCGIRDVEEGWRPNTYNENLKFPDQKRQVDVTQTIIYCRSLVETVVLNR